LVGVHPTSNETRYINQSHIEGTIPHGVTGNIKSTLAVVASMPPSTNRKFNSANGSRSEVKTLNGFLYLKQETNIRLRIPLEDVYRLVQSILEAKDENDNKS
jgi:replication-associated recombination protein RarA